MGSGTARSVGGHRADSSIKAEIATLACCEACLGAGAQRLELPLDARQCGLWFVDAIRHVEAGVSPDVALSATDPFAEAMCLEEVGEGVLEGVAFCAEGVGQVHRDGY